MSRIGPPGREPPTGRPSIRDVYGDADLGPLDRWLWAVLCEHADKQGRVWLSRSRLARMTGMSVRSVDKSLNELEQRGYATRCATAVYDPEQRCAVFRPTESGLGRGITNVYKLDGHPGLQSRKKVQDVHPSSSPKRVQRVRPSRKKGCKSRTQRVQIVQEKGAAPAPELSIKSVIKSSSSPVTSRTVVEERARETSTTTKIASQKNQKTWRRIERAISLDGRPVIVDQRARSKIESHLERQERTLEQLADYTEENEIMSETMRNRVVGLVRFVAECRDHIAPPRPPRVVAPEPEPQPPPKPAAIQCQRCKDTGRLSSRTFCDCHAGRLEAEYQERAERIAKGICPDCRAKLPVGGAPCACQRPQVQPPTQKQRAAPARETEARLRALYS